MPHMSARLSRRLRRWKNRSRTFVRKVYGSWPVNPRLWARIVPNEKCLMRGTRRADVACVETNAAEPLFDAQSGAFEEAESAGAVQDPLKLYVRAIGDGRLLTAAEERELARLKDEGDEGARRKL